MPILVGLFLIIVFGFVALSIIGKIWANYGQLIIFWGIVAVGAYILVVGGPIFVKWRIRLHRNEKYELEYQKLQLTKEQGLLAVRNPQFYIERWKDRIHTTTLTDLADTFIRHFELQPYVDVMAEIHKQIERFDKAAFFLEDNLPHAGYNPHSYLQAWFPTDLKERKRSWPLKDAIGMEIFADICENMTFRIGSVDLPEDSRFEHEFVLATSGSGKTTLLEQQILTDFAKVQRGEATVIVIDGEDELIPKLAHTAQFRRGGSMEGRLILLEADAEYPVSLNIFQTPKLTGSINEIAEAQKEIRETIKDCISAVNDIQGQLLDFLIEFCLVIPNANMLTLLELLMPGGLKKYARYLNNLDVVAKGYFASTFIAQNSKPTQDALLLRLNGMLKNPPFRKMFMQERSLFNLEEELGKGRVILINTKRSLLGDEGCKMMGKFFLANLMQASMKRGAKSLPVYCYVDEVQDVAADFTKLGDFLLKARKRRIAMILATQQPRKFDPFVLATMQEDTAIRFATTGKERARGMYQLYVRRLYVDPITVRVLLPDVEPAQMSDAEYAHLQSQMRARYCAPTRANALTLYEPTQEPPQRPYRPQPPPSRVFDAEWWEVNDEPSTALVRAPRLLPKPDDLPPVPQPKKRRRR